MSLELASAVSTGVVDADSDAVAAALVESDAVGTAPSDGAAVGVAVGPAASLDWPGLAVAEARLADAVGVGAAAALEVAGGLEDGLLDGLAVGVAEPWPPPPFP